MSRRLQLLLIAGLLVPAGIAEAQARPRMSIIRPRIERQFVLRNRMPTFRRFEFERGLFRRQAAQRWNMRLHSGPMLRGRAWTLMPRQREFTRFRIGRRHSIRI
jgi:hypothetical protein